MLKLAVCLSLLVSTFYDNSENVVEMIEYNVLDYTEEGISMNVTLNVDRKTIITMKVYFFDENKNILNNKYYESSMILEKDSRTLAKIPIQFRGKIYLNIVFENRELNEEIENIFFPVYEKEKGSCDFSIKKSCNSSYPVKVVYENGRVNEFYENVFLVNEDLHIRSFNNRLPIENFAIKTSINKEEKGYASLYIDEKLESINVYYSDKYEFPLEVYYDSSLLKFKFANKYYLDYLKGVVSEEYENNLIFDNNIVFPFVDKAYAMEIVLFDAFYAFDNVRIPFMFETRGNLVGNCDESKYCIKRGYL